MYLSTYALCYWNIIIIIIIVLSLESFESLSKRLEIQTQSHSSKMASSNSLVDIDMGDSNDVTNSCLEDSNSEYFPCSPVPSTSGENPEVLNVKRHHCIKHHSRSPHLSERVQHLKQKQVSLFRRCCFVLLMILNSRTSLRP